MKCTGRYNVFEGGGLVHDPMLGRVGRCVVGEEVGLVHDPGVGYSKRAGKCVQGEEGVHDPNQSVREGAL